MSNPSLTQRAAEFAAKAHYGQVRKYTGEPYFTHPVNVAGLVRDAGGTDEMIAAAYLHDTLEDTDTHWWDLYDEFGPTVMAYVLWLTDPSLQGNRAYRKAAARAQLATAPPEVQTIKLADLIDNTASIVQNDPKFAKVYLEEKRLLLQVLIKGDPDLQDMAFAMTKLP
jgi:(p)ppGpp synthase/HD superfamily hydrolase